jgi:hypothetical protein
MRLYRLPVLLSLASLACSGSGGSGSPDGSTVTDVPANVQDLAADAAIDDTGDAAGLPDGAAGVQPFQPTQPGQPLATVPVTPADGGIAAFGDQLLVEVPAGAVASEGELVVTGGPTTATDLPLDLQATYDVKLMVGGEAVQPLVPVSISFRLYPEQLVPGSDDPAERVVATVLEEGATEWGEVPYEVMNDLSGDPWMRVTTPHLTGFAEWLCTPTYAVLSVPGWKFYFDPNKDAFGLGAKNMEEIVVKYREVLDTAHDAYVAAGFKSPREAPTNWKKISVYVLPSETGGAEYNPKSGNVMVNTKIADDDEARDEASHEVFHLFQNAQLNYISMNARRWFVEAAATWAADRLATQAGKLPKVLKPKFLATDFTVCDGKHEYGTSALLDWVISHGGKLKAMQDLVFTTSAITDDPVKAFEKYVMDTVATPCPSCATCPEFAALYAAFAEWLLFSPGSLLKVDPWADAVADNVLTLDAASPSATVTVEVLRRTARVVAFRIALPAGERLVQPKVEPTENSYCIESAWHVPGDSQKAAMAIPMLPDCSLSPVMAKDGDVVAVVLTTPDHCDADVSAGNAQCEMGPESGGGYGPYECTDYQGLHTATANSCDGSKFSVHWYTCYGGACLEETWNGDCAVSYPGDSEYCALATFTAVPVPACTSNPPGQN